MHLSVHAWYCKCNVVMFNPFSALPREDVPPPKSRVSTARSFTSVGSQRSSLGSMSPSNLHEYSKPQYDKIPSDEFERPPSHAPLPPPGKPAGPNLSRMGAIPVMIPAQNRDGSIV